MGLFVAAGDHIAATGAPLVATFWLNYDVYVDFGVKIMGPLVICHGPPPYLFRPPPLVKSWLRACIHTFRL